MIKTFGHSESHLVLVNRDDESPKLLPITTIPTPFKRASGYRKTWDTDSPWNSHSRCSMASTCPLQSKATTESQDSSLQCRGCREAISLVHGSNELIPQ